MASKAKAWRLMKTAIIIIQCLGGGERALLY